MSTTEKDIPGCDLLTCIELARSIDKEKCIHHPSLEPTGKIHLIVITNTLVDESEFPKPENVNDIPLHITYWVVTMNPVNIIDREGLTVIEGYDINVYNALVNQMFDGRMYP
jgi:hypothetical protein